MEIEENQGNEDGVGSSCSQLGNLARLKKKFEEAGQWCIKALVTFTKCNDNYSAQKITDNFMLLFRQASPKIRQKLKAMWEEKIGDFPE
ncbi:MAG: hypothetical protein GY754_05135 [bacterium]|nr:hypothetical protein [bacterium]